MKASRPATAKSQQSGSHLSRMSETRRTRLEEIQKREQLKGMLITKFKKKYSDKNGEIQGFINKEVQNFMTQNRLTETNLAELDDKIKLEVAAAEKRAEHIA